MERKFVTVDVFTDRRFGGNPLAVVLDAEDLATPEMQGIAAEFNLAETTFVLSPKDPGTDRCNAPRTLAVSLAESGNPAFITGVHCSKPSALTSCRTFTSISASRTFTLSPLAESR